MPAHSTQQIGRIDHLCLWTMLIGIVVGALLTVAI